MNGTSIILKTDSRGRVRTPLERREELVSEFKRSGLSATKFAALVGVKYQTFATWVQRRKVMVGRPRGSKPVRLVEAVAEVAQDVPSAEALRILLPGGASLEVTERAQESEVSVPEAEVSVPEAEVSVPEVSVPWCEIGGLSLSPSPLNSSYTGMDRIDLRNRRVLLGFWRFCVIL